MSKMGNEMIREADGASMDNADEVWRLRREILDLTVVIDRTTEQAAELRAENRRLRLANATMLGSLEGIEKGLREGGLMTHEHILRIVERFRDADA